MRTIGLLGGMTCEATVPYDRIINTRVPLFDTLERHARAAARRALDG